MNPTTLYPVPEPFAKQTHLNASEYHVLYKQSINQPETFWATQAKRFITWFTPWEHVMTGSFRSLDVQWFTEATLNACYNCIDRHLPDKSHQIALIWEGNEPGQSISFTYQELHQKICTFANVLKSLGVCKGDRVCIYLPMIPEVLIAMLACARIGAIHSVVFAGFSPEALKTRILDAECQLVITADQGLRGEKHIPLKDNVDKALVHCPGVKKVLVIQKTSSTIDWIAGRDHWYHELQQQVSNECPVEPMKATDPLFILYTSGSTGKPKGILHSTGGYLVYTAITYYYAFDYHPGDIHWCTADAGWITGHSYLVYGPLLNGATTVMYEGVPNYPNYARFWQIIDKHQVNVFYTAPTAIRSLRKEGDDWVQQTSRQSLKLLGSVGEPINPEVWEWYYRVVGEARCPVIDTWWQTETGGIMLTSLPGATPMAPGSAGWPFFGIIPEVIPEAEATNLPSQAGKLIIKHPWPGMMQTIYHNPERFAAGYFKEVPGSYLTGDGAYCDDNGYYWITGRMDDVIKVSGHRIGSEEVESALLSHPSVAEAAVVSIPDALTGESIYAFVTLKHKIHPDEDLKQALIQQVRDKIGAIATIKTIQWVHALPKTRSGKIMRRILRQIAAGQYDQLGDLSTLAETHVIEQLIQTRET